MTTYISITITDEDVRQLAEQYGVPYADAQSAVSAIADALGDYASGEVMSELAVAVEAAGKPKSDV